MRRIFFVGLTTSAIALIALFFVNAQSKRDKCGSECAKSKKPAAMSTTTEKPVACKLTSKEMQVRKATIIAELKKEVIERKELLNGYAYKFSGEDKSIDRLVAFIKTERACCGFFTFNLSITEDFAVLELTGPEGAKDFVDSEIGL